MKHVIGDVHGCRAELEELLATIGNQGLVFVGDLVGRGPDTIGTLDLVMDLEDAVVLRGNHEASLLRSIAKGEPRNNEEGEFFDRIEDKHVEFLKSTVLVHEVDGGVIAVHGGIPTEWTELPPADWESLSKNQQRKRRLDRAMLQRWITPAGKFVSLGNEKDEDVFWAEKYDGRFGLVIFGHEPLETNGSAIVFPKAIGIDLGCVFGGYLCAVSVSGGAFVGQIVVESRGTYATRTIPGYSVP